MACSRRLAALVGSATAALVPSWGGRGVFAESGSKNVKPKSMNDLYFGLMTKSRCILLSGGVDEDSAKQIVGQLMYLETESPGSPITFYIHSSGGNVQSGLYIYDMMQHISSPVHTVCAGRCYSMGAILLAGGEKGERSALPHCKVMIHQPNRTVTGARTSKSLHIDADALENTRKTLHSILEQHATLSREELELAMENDTYMDASEAIKAGLIDKVLEPKQKTVAGTDKNRSPPGNAIEYVARPPTEKAVQLPDQEKVQPLAREVPQLSAEKVAPLAVKTTLQLPAKEIVTPTVERQR